LILMLSRLLFIVLILNGTLVNAQFTPGPEPEESQFIFPIRPNNPNTLAGTMGELRSTHFHNGIDIRTGGKTGVPVQAAARGYIVRVSVSTGGYGNALYLKHPDGKMTVYAHLDSFADDIADYVLKEQYRTQQFSINLFPKEDQFSFEQGDVIGLSGNSGSSGGPHLHFDIRGSNNDLLAPLQFKFSEVIDTRPPEVRKVALKTLDRDSRINGQFGRFEFNVEKVDGKYIIEDTIQAIGTIGYEIYAYDRQNNTRFRTGIRTINLLQNGQNIFSQTIDRLSFSEKSSFYVHTDYRSLVTQRSRFHKLYVDDGNNLSIYKTDDNRGKITIPEGKIEEITVEMIDPYGNSIAVEGFLKGIESTREVYVDKAPKRGVDIIDNTLLLVSKSRNALFFQDSGKYIQGPDYLLNDSLSVYLIDLRKDLPDSIDVDEKVISTDFVARIPSGELFNYYSKTADIEFGPRDLYDTLYFTYSYEQDSIYREVFTIGKPIFPIKRTITVKLKPQMEYADKERTLVYAKYGNNLGFAGGEWQGDEIVFYTRGFGKYVLATDSIPPKIYPSVIGSDKVTFKVEDNRSGIKSIKATIDGEWLLMHHDPKTRRLWSERKEKNKPLKGEFILVVTDNVGNISTFKRKI